jgi:hypothetical protein
MRRLLIYCDGGFGNRFNALVSGLVLARTLDLSPQVVWPVNNWCGAAFGELFANEMDVVERELATFVPERGRYQYFIVEDRLGIADRWATPLQMAGWDAVRSLLSASTQDIFYYTALIPPFIAAADIVAQVRSLRLRDEIVSRARAFLGERQLGAVPGDLLGVQIRKTDFGSNGADDDNLYQLISRCPQRRFFVCSDDKAVEARFAALANVVIHAKTAHVEKLVQGEWTTPTADHSGRVYPCNVNRSAQSVIDAVVDLLILSHSQIVKTSNSTFLNTALLLQASR